MCKCKDENDTKVKSCCILDGLFQVDNELQRLSDVLDNLIVAYKVLDKTLSKIGEVNA